MKEFFSSNLESIIGFIIALIVTALGKVLEVNNSLLSNVMTALSPVIFAFLIYINTAKGISKIKLVLSRKKNITLKFIGWFDMEFQNDEQYNKLINLFKDKYPANLDKKIIIQEMGGYINTTTIKIDSIYYELMYRAEDCRLYLKIDNKISGKYMYNIIKSAYESTIEAISKIDKISQDANGSSIEVRFINTDNSNPIMSKVFSGFRIKSLNVKYETENNTTIEHTSDRIVLRNSQSIESIIADIKKEFRLW